MKLYASCGIDGAFSNPPVYEVDIGSVNGDIEIRGAAGTATLARYRALKQALPQIKQLMEESNGD